MENKKHIGKRYLPFLIFFIFICSSVLALDNCPSSTVTIDKIPCLILLPFNLSGLNCANYNVQIWNDSNLIETQILSNYSPDFMCNATFNQTALGTYTIKWSSGDTGKLTVEVGYMNLLIGIIFLAMIITFTILTHKTRDLQGSSFIYSGLVFVFSLMFGAMLLRGYRFIEGIFPFDVNFYLSLVMILYSFVFMVVTINLVMEYKTKNPSREIDPREY